ncbi:serine/threonine-protein kinase [Streptomyces poriferorum]|uniref:serine/threonine-protein kinase n=1 Tax=Streptomyces poriferorum TaxID=2798799 RepID=UPI00273F0CFA|nr:serine/threonine-protein kinase [Streptomyces sp. Alt1]WLQ49819.1 serine/threonine-protein kinase [Streptomyces sp. Alt1]
MDTLLPGDPSEIGPYRLIGRLGAGGMGRVYLARSEAGRTVAIKVVHDGFAHSPEFRRRFAQEVESARKVGGTWTAPVLDADTECPTPWVVIGYVPGPDLHTVVSAGEHGPLPVESVLALANGLARALGDVHGAGLVHRDLKPSNVLLTVDGPRVIDFGIARAVETPVDGFLTRTGAVIGSPGFMSPEQVRGERRLTPASDVFCLGAVLHYAATGRTPFGALDSGAHALMFRIAEEEADLTGLPSLLVELVRNCLRKDPRDRPATQDIAAETEPWAPDTRPAWLPAELLASIGSRADPRPTQYVPAPTTETEPEPEPLPQGRTEPSTETAVQPIDRKPQTTPGPEPRDGGKAPDESARRPRNPKIRRRLALATGLLVLIGAGVALAPMLSNGDDAAGHNDRKPKQTASASPRAFNSEAFVGTWSGEASGRTQDGDVQFISFTITSGNPSTGNRADVILQYPERACLGHVGELRVVSGQAVLDAEHLSQPIEGDDDGVSCLPFTTQMLTLNGDVLEWRTEGATADLRKDTAAYADEELLRTYKGTWRTSDTTPSMGLSITDLRPGALFEFTGGEGAQSCAWFAGVTEATPDRLFGAVTRPTAPDIGICHGHNTFDIRPAGKDRLRVLTQRGVPYLFTRA